MNIAVYSGSFNPLHIGHLAIMKYLIGEGGFDSIYLIVSPKNPLKEGIDSASGQARYNAAVEAVRRHFPEPLSAGEYVVDMPHPARGCLTEGKTGVDVISPADNDSGKCLLTASTAASNLSSPLALSIPSFNGFFGETMRYTQSKPPSPIRYFMMARWPMCNGLNDPL